MAPLDLRARRGHLGLSAHDVADAVGVHVATVLRWERGERLPGPGTLDALAHALTTDRAAVVGFFDAHRRPAPPRTRVRATGLRTLRHRHGWSAAHVAALVGVPVPTVFNWESGRAGMPVELVPRVVSLLREPDDRLSPQEVRALLTRHRPLRPPHHGPLRRARGRSGLSQQRLAEQLGVSRQLVGCWERGLAPRIVHQRGIARILGTDVATVSGWFGTPPPLGLRPARWRPGDLGQVLRDLRAWSGLSQGDVARHCGCSTAAVRAWESGRTVPPAPQRERLAGLHRVPATAFDAALPQVPTGSRPMTLVLGVDSSTQSTKAVLVDVDDGMVVETRTAPHPPGTEVDPRAWLAAYDDAAGPLLDRASAVSVAGQQHGMVALDETGTPVRPALLWNDVRSAASARALVEEMGGAQACADAVGSVLVASFTSTKLRWLRDHEPAAADRVAEVLLPHDFVARHAAAPGTRSFTDRGDASGTGYFDTAGGAWRPDLLAAALGREAALPEVVPAGSVAATTETGAIVAAGTGDNMGGALGMALEPCDFLVSVGTSGVVSAISPRPVADGTGVVTGFADAEAGFLPMVTTMNAAGILDLQARWLGVDHAGLASLALSAPWGSGGLTLLPYYGGERTPNRPDAVGTWHGLTSTTTRAELARAAFEALLCSLADAVDQLVATTGLTPRRIFLVGGATRSPALRAMAPAVLGRAVSLPPPGEYVALGAARQAAWALAGTPDPPSWPRRSVEELAPPDDNDRTAGAEVRAAYARLRDRS